MGTLAVEIKPLHGSLKKKQSAPRPSEHPPVRGGKYLWRVDVVFFTLTGRVSTIPSNIRGCQSGTRSQRGTPAYYVTLQRNNQGQLPVFESESQRVDPLPYFGIKRIK